MDRALRFAYRRLGRRYPLTAVVLQFQLAHIVVLGGLGLLRLYQPISDRTFLALLVVAELLVALDNVSSTLLARRLLAPVAAWLDGAADRGATSAAWRALVSMPTSYARRVRTVPIFLVVVPFWVFATIELGLDPYAAVAVLIAMLLTLFYGALLRFFAMESLLRPVLADVALHMPDDFEPVRAGLPTRVPVISTDETGRLAHSFNDMVAGLQERERLHEAFGAYVGPNVAEMVLRDGPHLDGEELEVSVLCLDIRDFTRFAERASAREVVDYLNGFYDTVVPILVRHGGHANKYVGDGLLGVFGAPEPLSDHADRAVAAALEIGAAVRERYRGELRVGIGVNSGPVIAGTIGGGGHVEFTVIGDSVNTADRVEQVTRQTGDVALVTEATRRLLRDDHGGFDARPAVPLKGKLERVQLWAPRALQPAEG